MVAVNQSKEIELSKFCKSMACLLQRDSTFLSLMKTTLNFAIAFEEQYMEKFIATRTVAILKDMTDSDFLRGVDAQSYYEYT